MYAKGDDRSERIFLHILPRGCILALRRSLQSKAVFGCVSKSLKSFVSFCCAQGKTAEGYKKVTENHSPKRQHSSVSFCSVDVLKNEGILRCKYACIAKFDHQRPYQQFGHHPIPPSSACIGGYELRLRAPRACSRTEIRWLMGGTWYKCEDLGLIHPSCLYRYILS